MTAAWFGLFCAGGLSFGGLRSVLGTACAGGGAPQGGKKLTASSVPKWSPISVPTGLDQAFRLKSDGCRCIGGGMAAVSESTGLQGGWKRWPAPDGNLKHAGGRVPLAKARTLIEFGKFNFAISRFWSLYKIFPTE